MKAIILKKNSFEEGSEIITMYSRELGKVRGFARSVKFPKSRLAHGLQQLFYSEVEVAKSRKNFVVTGVKVLDTFPALRADLHRVNSAMYAVELILKSTADENINEELFDYFLGYLKHLNSIEHADLSPACLSFFTFELLALNGYSLELGVCNLCKKELPKNAEHVFFSNRKGGFLCADCSRKSPDAVRVSPQIYSSFLSIPFNDFAGQDLSAQQPGFDLKEFSSLAYSFATFILERDLKSKAFI